MPTRKQTATASNDDSSIMAKLDMLLKLQEQQAAEIAALKAENEALKARPGSTRTAKPVVLITADRSGTCGCCGNGIAQGAQAAYRYGHKPMCADCFKTGASFVQSARRMYETTKRTSCADCGRTINAGSIAYYSKAEHKTFCKDCSKPASNGKQHKHTDGDDI